MGHDRASCVFRREQPFTKLVYGLITLENPFLATLVLYNAQIGLLVPFFCRHSRSKNNSSLMNSSTASSSASCLPCRHSVSKKAATSYPFSGIPLLQESVFSLFLGFGLDIAAMPFELQVLAAGPALSLSTKMFLGCLMTSIDNLHTFHASDQTLTDVAGIAFRPFMLIITPLAL